MITGPEAIKKSFDNEEAMKEDCAEAGQNTERLPRDCPEMWNLQGNSFDDKNTLEVERLFLFK